MKKPDKKYWVGICPPDDTVEIIAALKQELKAQTGWYASVNSKAHITFCEFFDSMGKLEKMEQYIHDLCTTLKHFNVCLTHTNRLHNAYCLYPDEASKDHLIRLMRHFHAHKPFGTETKSIHPHVSIGRKLNEEQLALAESLFAQRAFNIHFVCRGLTIRKFNPAKEQYDVYKEFPFKNMPLFLG